MLIKGQESRVLLAASVELTERHRVQGQAEAVPRPTHMNEPYMEPIVAMLFSQWHHIKSLGLFSSGANFIRLTH